jgi:hypothetical protein
MAIDERARHQLYLRLEEHLGAEAATTLMEHLPPAGWADVATKRDLDQLRAITKADLDHAAALLRAEIDRATERTKSDLHKMITTHTVLIVFTVMASNLTAVFAVAQLR